MPMIYSYLPPHSALSSFICYGNVLAAHPRDDEAPLGQRAKQEKEHQV
jgi:hypothetical protein